MTLNRLPTFVVITLIGFTIHASAQQSTLPIQQVGHATEATPTKPSSLGPHQGTLKTVGQLQTETVVTPAGIRVYLYSASGQPLAVEQARGVASLSVKGNAKRYRYDLFPGEDQSLKVDMDLSSVAGRQITVDYQLVGLARKTIAFRDVTVVPADRAQADAVAIARQKVCPVSGKPLGSMGDPVAVDVSGQRLFVCCAGCVSAVKANPAKYASGRPKVEIVTATNADGALIAKQKTCPVMDEPLGSMGKPIKLLVGGKPIFLCCKGCIKKVQAQPEKYLAMVYNQSADSTAATVPGTADAVRPGVFKVTAADKPYIAAQKTCPVMDEPLDAMGGPYRVNANGKAIYICCPGCAKKIAAEPEKYIAILKQQNVEAPMIR